MQLVCQQGTARACSPACAAAALAPGHVHLRPRACILCGPVCACPRRDYIKGMHQQTADSPITPEGYAAMAKLRQQVRDHITTLRPL